VNRLLLIGVLFCTVGADTNSLTMTNLTAHQRFYVGYRAQKARLEAELAQAQESLTAEELLLKKKMEANSGLVPGVTKGKRDAEVRVARIKSGLAKLDLARLQYERRYPEAAQFANSPPVTSDLFKSIPKKAVPVVILNDPAHVRTNAP
jgi:hypothetical protein